MTPVTPTDRLTVLVTAPLSLDPVPRIMAAAPNGQVRVEYHPHLLPPQRFVADHRGEPDCKRDPADQPRWEHLLSQADVSLGVPGDNAAGLRALVESAPKLSWVQGTAAGAGEQLAGADLTPAQLDRITMTSAAGLHAVPLAEFAIFGLLAFAKDSDRLRDAQIRHQWLPRWPMKLMSGTTILVLGLGGIGREVARLAAAFGVTVLATRRSRSADGKLPEGVSRLIDEVDLDATLSRVDAVVCCLPGTGQTKDYLATRRLSLLPAHAVVVNVGRGAAINIDALVTVLRNGAIRAAVLDVTAVEPLPADSPLWDLENVIISPHTAALTTTEDHRIVELFATNLERRLNGDQLINQVDPARGY